MAIVFFDLKGQIYTNIVLNGKSVNSAYIGMARDRFLKNLKEKSPQLSEQGFVFYWDNALVHTAVAVKDWFSAHSILVLKHAPYSPDLAPANFFLFPKVKELLACTNMTADGVKKAWEGVTRTIAEDEYTTAFWRWYEKR